MLKIVSAKNCNMSFNYSGVPNTPIQPKISGMGMPGPMMPGPQMPPQGFMGPIMTWQTPGPADPGAQFSMPNMILPGMNDNPLEFNMNKNKPPMPIPLESNNKEDTQKSSSPSDRSRRRADKRERDRERREDKDKRDEREKENNSRSDSSPGDVPSTPLTPNMWSNVVNMGYQVMGMNMIMDPNMMGMNNYGMMQPMMAEGAAIMPQQDPAMIPQNRILPNAAIKEIIHCKSCTLFPPNPNAPPPTTRERPPGCRTVFVGGLPENITEDIIMEVFERCGEITTLRLSKKNFCHIRFVYEEYVDHAIFLSGYRIRLGSNTDSANNGRLHVDYAQARDDQYEWECRQRQLQREQRHRERMEEERMRPPSPPPVVHYTDHEASSVAEKIKQDESFSKAVQIVITWLERGDCSKRNSNTFYSMIQSTNSHVRRLLSEKAQYEEELQKAREIMKGRMQGILIQFGQIERVFSAACHKKVWDHFTKAQRKNIEMWKKQSMEIKTIQLEDALNERADDEMDVSDEDDNGAPPIRKRTRNIDCFELERINLKEENDSLKCQLEAYKNEVDIVRNEMKMELENKEKQLKILQQTLQGMQQQLIETRRKQNDDDNRVHILQHQKIDKLKPILDGDSTIIDLDGVDSVKSVDSPVPTEYSKTESPEANTLSDRDAKLIGVISTFLHVHPFGAGVDYVWSYVHKLEPTLKPADVENLMSRFPAVFKQELSGIGANLERRWQFNGFNNVSTADNKKLSDYV